MSGKLLVTHASPDLDAIASVWIFKRFLHADFASAPVLFVPAGQTLPPEQAAQLGVMERDVVHTDTGWGPFDHHQPERAQTRACATSLVYQHLCKIQEDKIQDHALRFIVEYVTQIDHFEDSQWHEAASLRHELLPHGLIDGAKNGSHLGDEELLEFGFTLLNAAYGGLKEELKAEEAIQLKGQNFKLGNFKALAVASSNGAVEKRAQKMGYDIVVRKDEEQGHVRVKVSPKAELDLTPVYERILQEDLIGTWYLHGSKRMLINGSRKNPSQIPSPLSLVQVVQIVKDELGEA